MLANDQLECEHTSDLYDPVSMIYHVRHILSILKMTILTAMNYS